MKKFQIGMLYVGIFLGITLQASQGSDVDAWDSLGATALMNAAWAGDLAQVKQLLKAGADVGLKHQREQKTAYTYAVERGKWDVVEEFLTNPQSKHKIDVNARDSAGATVLMHAAWQGNVQGLKALLEAGADASLKANDGRTAWDYARDRGNVAAMSVLW